MALITIRTKKPTGKTSLYFRIQIDKQGIFLNSWLQTPVKVDVEKWNAYKQIGKLESYISKLKCGSELLQLEYDIRELAAHGEANLDVYRKMIHDILNADAVKAADELNKKKLQAAEAAERKRIEAAEAAERKKKKVLIYASALIDRLEKGECLSRKGEAKRLDKNTIKAWRSFYKVLEKFYNGDNKSKLAANPFDWDSIDRKLCMKFRCFLESEGYLLKTAWKYITTFAALTMYAYDDGIHTNIKAVDEIRKVKPKVNESDKAAEIYLTTEELQSLYEMPLSGLKEQVRDLFLIGCYTCQRFSDYSRIKPENITKSMSGKFYQIKMRQEKTGNCVTIPLLNDNVKELLAKYNNQVPKISDVVLNRYIKVILKDLSESVPSLCEERITQLTMRERAKEAKGELDYNRDDDGNVLKPRFELVSSHTARRSGITNLYKTGLFDTYQMMSISGHKDVKTFREYIKLSGDEIAENIALTIDNNNVNF